ncbi:MAG: o-succinylbenzoate synthase [Cyanothece sp. SIO1E1]|nr:o-succinylbenzoate synthase [Cyanothece sp. SIO1E1]
MTYQFQFRPYRRQFKRPVKTSHGTWQVRSGIILRCLDEAGQIGFGEIAPLSWFGSETYEQALAWCQQWPKVVTADEIFTIPDRLPACQFGFESAWANCSWSKNKAAGSMQPTAYCGLLTTGAAALQNWPSLWQAGYHHLKWKIGIAPMADELCWLNQLVESLPPSAKLRLDANGGLNLLEAQKWLEVCDQIGIEFLEQPLPPEQLDAMLALEQHYQTPLALDESVATLNQLKNCYEKGWRGIFVVKAAIAGSPTQLRTFTRVHPVQLVFSSVFETSIGRTAALQLAAELNHADLAVGFGIQHWFADDLELQDFENLWQRLG